MNNSENQVKIILFFTIFVAMLGLSVLFPIMAQLSREIGFTEIQAGLFATGYSVMQFLFSPYWGKTSEKIGRKPVLIIGLFGFAISFLIFGIVSWLALNSMISGYIIFVLLLLSRLIGGALSSASLPTAQAMMADLSTEENRTSAMALVGAAFGLGVIFGPAIGSFLARFGLVAPIFFSAFLAFSTAIFAVFKITETKRTDTVKSNHNLLKNKTIITFLAMAMVYTMASVGMEQTISFMVSYRLALSPFKAVETVGILLTLFGITAAGVQGFIMRGTFKQIPTIVLIKIGTLIMGFGMLGLAFANSFYAIAIYMCLVGFGSAVLGPSLTAALSVVVSEDKQGEIAGLNSSALALGRVMGPLLGTSLYQYIGNSAPYYLSAFLLFILFVISFQKSINQQFVDKL